MRLALFVFVAVLGVSQGRWLRRARSDQPKESSFVGEATNELSTAILQGYIDDEKNLAFSPLGYSAILAILAEGARGETKQQLSTALHLPEDVAVTRKIYNFIMERLKNTNEYKFNQPELKNWFYIYRNYTINDDYKKILEDHYLTEVRTVERYVPYNPNKDDDTSEEDKENPESTEKENVKSKDEIVKETNYQPEETKKDEETADLLPPKEDQETLISFAVEDKPVKVEEVPVDFEYKPAKNIKEKIKLVKTYPKKTDYSSDDEETMVAVEARNHRRSLKVLFDKNDISSSISVNSVGKKMSKASNSLMIMFNGMYFRGAWKKPFEKEEPGTFYQSPTAKKQVPMMKTRGTFRTGSLPGLDSMAIELPYDGGRYTLLVVVPRARDGLNRLIADLPAAPLSDLHASLREEELDVSLPSFYVETTTKPVAALAKFGVSSIFSPEADLSGISPVDGLFVQEMVQHVAVRVDNAKSVATEITADSMVQSLKNAPIELEKKVKKFSVEHPFVFFINDMLDNLVVVAGKVTDPQQPAPSEI